MAIVKAKPSKVAVGNFSPVNGSKVRRMWNEQGEFLGTITKLDQGGYKVFRAADGKTRIKKLMADAYKSIRRVN